MSDNLKEREAFEAWFKEKSPVGGINAKLAAWDAWRAALAQAQSLPDGWKLVPVEPTEEMLNSLWLELGDHPCKEHALDAWRQALQVAPMAGTAVVPPTANADNMNRQHGEAYGVDWVYSSPAQPVQPSEQAALHEVRAHLSHINKLLDAAVPVAQAKPEQAAQPECTCLTGGLGPHYCERHSP
jgi:hypothetical protein